MNTDRCLLTVVILLASPAAPDGTEPMIDYPDDQWLRNVGSRIDGAGMCVFTSFEHACRWAGLEEFRGFRDWCARKFPGGGYPEKLDRLVRAYCKEHRLPVPDVIQYEGSSTELLEAALRNGYLPCVTLYGSPRYGRGTIYHMVNCAHLDRQRGAILDNNFQPLEWTDRATTIRRMKLNGKLWAVIVLAYGPPPFPHHGEQP